jgi:hypothetical protein
MSPDVRDGLAPGPGLSVEALEVDRLVQQLEFRDQRVEV